MQGFDTRARGEAKLGLERRPGGGSRPSVRKRGDGYPGVGSRRGEAWRNLETVQSESILGEVSNRGLAKRGDGCRQDEASRLGVEKRGDGFDMRRGLEARRGFEARRGEARRGEAERQSDARRGYEARQGKGSIRGVARRGKGSKRGEGRRLLESRARCDVSRGQG
jgi:hypothetical protein